jgi:hypothetical protein
VNNPIVLGILVREHQEQLRREADAYRLAHGVRFDAVPSDDAPAPRRLRAWPIALVGALVLAVAAAHGAALPPVA